MPTINDASRIYVGSAPAVAVYVGMTKVWPTGTPPPYDPATVAYLAATGLDSSYAPALDVLVAGLKTTGLWSKMMAVYPMIGGTADLHKWNLLDPRDTDDAYRLTFTGGTHSALLGYRPNPEGFVVNGGQADTHFVPLGNMDVNSTHLAYYSLADVPATSRCEMGCYNWAGSGSRFHIIARYAPTQFYYGQNEDGASNVDVLRADGLFVATRLNAANQAAYRNGVFLGGNASPPASGLSTHTIWVGGINDFADRTDLPCGFASFGDGLGEQNNADLYSVVQSYQAALGRAT